MSKNQPLQPLRHLPLPPLLTSMASCLCLVFIFLPTSSLSLSCTNSFSIVQLGMDVVELPSFEMTYLLV